MGKKEFLEPAAATGRDIAELHRLIAETIPHMMWIARPDGWLEFFNGRVFDYTGLTSAELEGWGWKPVIHPDDWQMCLDRWMRALESGEPYQIEYRLRRGSDGAYRWHLGAARPLRDAASRIVKWFGTCTDIEDQKRAAGVLENSRRDLDALVAERTRALKESEARFRALTELSSDWYWEQDEQFRFIRLAGPGAAANARSGDPSVYVGKARWEIPDLAPVDGDWAKHRARLERHEPFRDMVLRRQMDDGTVRYMAISGEPIFDANGRFAGYRGIGRNITERKRDEQRLRDYSDRVRSLVNRLVHAQEEERRKLSFELHDLIGQKLTALGIELDIVHNALPARVATRLATRLGDMKGLVEGTVDAIRHVMAELHPAPLDDHGLVPALYWYAQQFELRTGLHASVSAKEFEPRLSPDAELALFRIVQEALTNAAKHSGATCVRVSVARDAERVAVSVEDDGKGFAEPAGARAAKRGGWGLPVMRERAEAVGATLRLEFPGVGTRVVVELAVRHDDPGAAG